MAVVERGINKNTGTDKIGFQCQLLPLGRSRYREDAEGETRTRTPLRALVPETSVYTISPLRQGEIGLR